MFVLTTIMLTVTMEKCSKSNHDLKYKRFICCQKPFICRKSNGDAVEFTFNEKYIEKTGCRSYMKNLHVLSFLLKKFLKNYTHQCGLHQRLGQTSTIPKSLTNILHDIHGQLSMVKDLILALKADNVEACFFYLVLVSTAWVLN